MSDQVRYPEDRFSQNKADITNLNVQKNFQDLLDEQARKNQIQAISKRVEAIMSRVIKNEGTDQLRSNSVDDQRLCFHYI